MKRSYATPLAFKQSVEQRLKTEALETGMDLHRLRQLLVFDRFLARLFMTYQGAVVLKGGLSIERRLDRARTTKDIDLRLVGDPDDVLRQLQAAGRIDLGEFLVYEVQPDRQHHEIRAAGMAYTGLRYRAETRLAGKPYGAPFGIDVAFAEPLHGEVEVVQGSAFLQFAGIEPAAFRIYPLETHIAEKLHAYTLPRDRPNSRVKDLPDIALLASAREITGVELKIAIEKTFAHRGTHPVPDHVPDPPDAWGPVYERLAREDDLPWKNLAEVTVAVCAFMDPVLAGTPAVWSPRRWTWR